MGIQSFGDKFDLTKLFRARDVARTMAYELASLLRPGMTEEDAHRLYKEISLKHGVEKQWHPAKLRFGSNSIRSFSEVSDPNILEVNDIFFLDIGPIVDGHEADYGETFSIGSNPEHKRICASAKSLWNEVNKHWKETRDTGIPLYEFAKKRATEMGHILHIESADGHRIGDFPHHVHFKGALIECGEQIVPNAWILEIHLLEPNKKFGAFFEDILTDQNI